MMQPGYSQVPITNVTPDVASELNRLYYNEFSYIRPLEVDLRLMSAVTPSTVAHALPPANFAETTEAYLVAVELPGIDIKDMTLQIVGQQMELTAFRKPIWTSGPDTTGFTVTEGRFGTMRRTIALPADSNVAGIQALCGHGLLAITIPKVSSAASRQAGPTVANITINAAL